jgi:hypothetical protein
MAALALAGASPAALAQVSLPSPGPGSFGNQAPEAGAPERVSVAQRPHPDYDPIGARLGGFLIFPSVDLSETYDSNIFAAKAPEVGDFFTDVQPAINVVSNFSRHALGFNANGEFKRYITHSSENVDNASATAGGRLDLLRDIYLLGGLQFRHAHEDRADPNSNPAQLTPTEYEVGGAGLGYVHERGRLAFRIDAAVNDYLYHNVPARGGGVVIESDRDRIELAAKPRVSYEIVPGYHAFVQVQGNARSYRLTHDQNGFNKNSSGYEVDAGTALDLGGIITGEVYAGYLAQNYQDSRLKPATGVGFGGNLLWNVTQLTSIRFTLSRSVQETVVTGALGAAIVDASGDVVTAVGAALEHELRRNVLLTAGLSYTEDNFQGISRTDNSYEADAGGRYLINRNLSAGLDLSYRKRDSNQTVNNYSREIVTARLRAQF